MLFKEEVSGSKSQRNSTTEYWGHKSPVYLPFHYYYRVTQEGK